MRELQKAAQDLRDIHSGAIVEPVQAAVRGKPPPPMRGAGRRKKSFFANSASAVSARPRPQFRPQTPQTPRSSWLPRQAAARKRRFCPKAATAAGCRQAHNGFYKIFAHKLALQLASARTAEVGARSGRSGLARRLMSLAKSVRAGP